MTLHGEEEEEEKELTLHGVPFFDRVRKDYSKLKMKVESIRQNRTTNKVIFLLGGGQFVLLMKEYKFQTGSLSFSVAKENLHEHEYERNFKCGWSIGCIARTFMNVVGNSFG